MRCKKCQAENPDSAKTCLKCKAPLGSDMNNDLPPLPDSPDHKKPKKHHAWLYGLCFGAFAIVLCGMVLVFAGLSAFAWSGSGATYEYTYGDQEALEQSEQTTDSSEAVLQDGEMDFTDADDFLDSDQNILYLPCWDIYIGVPDSEETTICYDRATDILKAKFKTEEDIEVTVVSSPTSTIPFSRSEEEAYFQSSVGYERIEGDEDQYFYTRVSSEQGQEAVVVDRLNGRVTVISVTPGKNCTASDPEKECSEILNEEILDQSSLL